MPGPIRFALRLAVAAALLASIAFVADLTPQGGTPYLSSLSSLGPSAALAAPGCNSKYCAKEPGRKSPTCHQSTSAYNCSASGGVCTVTAC